MFLEHPVSIPSIICLDPWHLVLVVETGYFRSGLVRLPMTCESLVPVTP
jgi:hypothetical protein